MSQTNHRSVLFIIADDWSPIAGCYGNEVISTPNIDKLADKGVVFDQAFCTSPSCAVSRACIMTGQHAHTHGQFGHCHSIHGFQTQPDMLSTSKLLGDHGYATALIGKCHTKPDSVYPFEYKQTNFPLNMGQVITDHFETFLNINAKGRPFYAHVASGDPHRAGGEGEPGARFGNGPQEKHTAVKYDPADVVVPDFLPDNDATRTDLANYYQAISRYDETVGKVLRVLEESGRADETLVIVTTDHAMPYPGAKASSYDTGHRCPFILYHPDMKKGGTRCGALMNWVDIFPTLVDWTGVGYPADAMPLAGRSVLPVAEDESEIPGDGDWDQTFTSHIFHEVTNYFPYRVIRRRQYKLVHNLAWQLPIPLPSDLFRSLTWTHVREQGITQLGKRNISQYQHPLREALYDIQADPMETENLIDKPELQDVAKEMRQALLDFRVRTLDPWLEYTHQAGDHADLKAKH
ncbi:MAG TPA: hypothetical protein DCM28_06900 [Phycisphaerales bacterium]|nr:hypothetical protein [Phycisphaerales bacterium]HCD32574.1 hypothetical protein [Phycisphaerales bacterium]|tara:strand:+ start:579 stop:1967 length:1389 start_codon:yes stop_codon:yes gene_type:complete